MKMRERVPASLLSATQEKFLAALLTHTTIKQAAAAVKITERTAQNYLDTPVFIKAYAEARKALVEETKNGLTALIPLSIQTLESVLRDDTVQANMRLKAIDMVFARILDAPIVESIAETQAGQMIIDPEALAHMTIEEKDIIQNLLRVGKERKEEKLKQGVA